MDKPDEVMIDFIRQVIKREGCWIIEPQFFRGSARLDHFLDNLRYVPSRLDHPPGTNPDAFATRQGRWLFVWVPTE